MYLIQTNSPYKVAKASLNKYVLRRVLNMFTEVYDLIDIGKPFHNFGAATEKASLISFAF